MFAGDVSQQEDGVVAERGRVLRVPAAVAGAGAARVVRVAAGADAAHAQHREGHPRRGVLRLSQDSAQRVHQVRTTS